MKDLVKRSGAILMIIALISTSFAASANQSNQHRYASWHMHNQRHQFKNLALNGQQHDQIFKIMYYAQPAKYEKLKRIRSIHRQLRAIAFSQYYDRNKARHLVSEETKIIASLKEMHNENLHKIFSILTSKQQQKIVARMYIKHQA